MPLDMPVGLSVLPWRTASAFALISAAIATASLALVMMPHSTAIERSQPAQRNRRRPDAAMAAVLIRGEALRRLHCSAEAQYRDRRLIGGA